MTCELLTSEVTRQSSCLWSACAQRLGMSWLNRAAPLIRRAGEVRSIHFQRHSRRVFIHAAAAEPHVAVDVPDAAASVEQLRSGLSYEASKGFCNAEGRQLFSQFAAEQFELLKQRSRQPEQRIALHRLVTGFQRYPNLSLEDRRALLLRANSAVGGPFLRSSPASVSISQQAERQASNSEASTSKPSAHGTSAALRKEKPKLAIQASSEPNQCMVALEEKDIDVADRVGSVIEEEVISIQAEMPEDSELNRITTLNLDDASPLAVETIRTEEAVSPSEDEQVIVGEAVEIPQVNTESGTARRAFLAAAAQHAQAVEELKVLQNEMLNGEQRTTSWHALRDNRLTASAFSNALGFWEEGRIALWEEKLGLREKFAGNEATQWGTVTEDDALARYVEITGHTVRSRSFKVLGEDLVTSWLGASPDGLIEVSAPGSGLRAAGFSQAPQGEGAGVLEIKCPFNRGNPMKAKAYGQAPWYYMPQVQGLMEVFDREWCNVFAYTVNNAALYHIRRDRRYWRDVYSVLAEFWWGSVVPAKHALAAGDEQQALTYRPSEVHVLTEQLKLRSKEMTLGAQTKLYPPKGPAMPRAFVRSRRYR